MSDKNELQELKETALKTVPKEIAVPFYQDVVHPSAKKIGEGLETITSTALLALEPFKGMVWSYEKIKKLITTKLTHKLETVAPEDIQTPKPSIAVPTIEALRYTA
ncbi:hypothetical protein GCM10023211_12930 [Orbus sasakiae]|uniref:Uncharacterized protein n=1 Tax=Orbus sasakiae TaxID=1078475 RepID=A0ABP9N4H8_9GAMM